MGNVTENEKKIIRSKTSWISEIWPYILWEIFN